MREDIWIFTFFMSGPTGCLYRLTYYMSISIFGDFNFPCPVELDVLCVSNAFLLIPSLLYHWAPHFVLLMLGTDYHICHSQYPSLAVVVWGLEWQEIGHSRIVWAVLPSTLCLPKDSKSTERSLHKLAWLLMALLKISSVMSNRPPRFIHSDYIKLASGYKPKINLSVV